MKFKQVHSQLKWLAQLVVCGLCLLSIVFAHAEKNQRYLNTDFDAYKKQQAIQDEALMQNQGRKPKQTVSTQSFAAPSQKVSKSHSIERQNEQSGLSKVNINQADEATIIHSLNGIGAVKAKAIVDFRKSNGKFKKAEDLLLVKGIGKATLAKNQDLLMFD